MIDLFPSLLAPAVAHSDSVLAWDFDHELSRCTYAGTLQWAPQRAPAWKKWWWVISDPCRLAASWVQVDTSFCFFGFFFYLFWHNFTQNTIKSRKKSIHLELMTQWAQLRNCCHFQLRGLAPERRRMPFLPTRMPSHPCLRRLRHPRAPRTHPTPGTRSALWSLPSSPRYDCGGAAVWGNTWTVLCVPDLNVLHAGLFIK